MKRCMLIVLSVAFLVSFSQSAFAGDPQPQYGGVLTVVNPRGPEVFGYPPEVRGYSTKYMTPCLEQLCTTDNEGQYSPLLSTAHELSPDGRSVTFTLKKGVKFHDGTDFNAEAAKWNLDLLKAARKPGTNMWTSIEVIDDYTLRVGFKKFQNNWPGVFSQNAYMISPSAVEQNGKEWALRHPVGTGPYKFKDFKRDVSVEYERFDGYWGDKPYLDGITYTIIKDPMTQVASFKKGKGDILETRTIKAVKDLQEKGFKIETNHILLMALIPDAGNPDSPFADERVRQAVEYAINRPAITNALGYGFWKPSYQPCPESRTMGYNPDLKGRQYNPEMARKLLAEAGYPNGFKSQIIQEPMDKNATTLIQSFLKDVGIEVDLNIVNRGRMMEFEKKGWNNGLIFKGIGTSANYIHTFAYFLAVKGKRVKSALRPDGWGEMLEKTLAARDFKTHKTLTQQAVKYVYDNSLFIPLWENPETAVLRQNVYNTNLYRPTLMSWTPGKAFISK